MQSIGDMTNQDGTNSELSLNNLTIADLEGLVTATVQKLLKNQVSYSLRTVSEASHEAEHPPTTFLETFGTWEDTRSAKVLVDVIYASRSIVTDTEYDL